MQAEETGKSFLRLKFESDSEEWKKALDYSNAFQDSILGAVEGARRLNETFGQNRQRITEISQAIADTKPKITALGGDIVDVFETIEAISKGTQKNIVASADDASKLFAAQKILGTSVETLTENFTEVGVQVSRIGPELENAVNSIQNIGLNVKQVMGDVTKNMDKLNQFNFSEGVNGLAKMASQASIFKFDMNETFQLANKALKPDGAIELASAFQRMGVAAGELTDPFQLMNMSLNDPAGLQKSLSKMTERYAEFDEKTKTFKINPSGLLQMRELADQTGISYKALSDSALAAANLDRALSQISPNINFGTEEDKQLISNIARMNENGEYEVNVKNELGKDVTTKLSDLNQDQFDKLLKEQKTAPKSLEEIARASMDTGKVIASDLRSIRDTIVGGFTSADQIRNFTENLQTFEKKITEKIKEQLPETSEIRTEATKGIQEVQDLIAKYQSGGVSKDELLKKVEGFEQYFNDLSKKAGLGIENIVSSLNDDRKKMFVENSPFKTTDALRNKDRTGGTGINNNEVDVNFKGGTINHNVNITPNIDNDFVNKLFQNPTFQNEFLSSLINADPVTKTKIKQALGF